MEAQHIHNKLIFDAFNDALDYFRPYSLNHEPFHWKKGPRYHAPPPVTEENIDDVLELTTEKVLDWAFLKCGLLEEKQGQLMMHFIGQGLPFDIDYLSQIRENKMNRMLQLKVFLWFKELIFLGL